jgi:penicillin-binding protein 1B
MGIRGAVAGKTGTTDNERDLWFVGFSPELVAVVWVGYDAPRPIGVPSSRGALPIWAEFMREAVGEHVRGTFLQPAGVRRIEVHPRTGARALPGCPERRVEYFLPNTEPSEFCVAEDRLSEPEAPRAPHRERSRSFWDFIRGL